MQSRPSHPLAGHRPASGRAMAAGSHSSRPIREAAVRKRRVPSASSVSPGVLGRTAPISPIRTADPFVTAHASERLPESRRTGTAGRARAVGRRARTTYDRPDARRRSSRSPGSVAPPRCTPRRSTLPIQPRGRDARVETPPPDESTTASVDSGTADDRRRGLQRPFFFSLGRSCASGCAAGGHPSVETGPVNRPVANGFAVPIVVAHMPA